MELSHLLKDFKDDIINNMATQLDTLQAKKKHEESEAMLVELCPHYRQEKKDCRCKLVANTDNHHVLEFNPVHGDDEQLFNVAQRRPWDLRQGMPPDLLSFAGSYGNSYVLNNQWQTPYAQNFGNFPP